MEGEYRLGIGEFALDGRFRNLAFEDGDGRGCPLKCGEVVRNPGS